MKKLLALLLTVTMVISMAACAPADPSDTTAGKADTTTAAKETTTAPTTTEPALDLTALPFVEPGSVKLTVGLKTNATVLDYNDNAYTKYLEEKTGIDLEFVFFSSDDLEANQQLSLMLANRETLPDIIFGILDSARIAEMGREGYLVDQTGYYDAYSVYHKAYVEENFDEVQKNRLWRTLTDAVTGEIYAFPSVNLGYTVETVGVQGGIDKVMAANVGMDIDEIDTVAEVYEYLKKTVKEDGNNNGKSDEMGMLFRANSDLANATQWVINAYVYCLDAELFNVTDGEVWTPYNTDEYRKALIELNKWYNEGLISPMSYSLTENKEFKPVIDPLTSDYTVSIFGGHPTLVCEASGTVGLEYNPLPILADETGKGGYATLKDPFACTGTAFITTDCENPELAYRLFDFMCADVAMHYARLGEEGVNWEHIDGEKEGLKDAMGNWAGIRMIKDEWSQETKATWHYNPVFAGDAFGVGHGSSAVDFSDVSNRRLVTYGNLWVQREGEVPAEKAVGMAYTEEEQDILDEYKKLYKGFVLESRAEFVTGAKDPNNDAVWQEYLEELEKNGESDLLDAYQSAYTRMIG